MSPDKHISMISAHLSAGRYEQLTPRFSFPAPVFVNDSAAIMANPTQIWGFFESLHTLFVTAELPQFSAEVAAIELPRSGRFRMWVDWVAMGPNGAKHAMRTQTFNRGTHADYKIEMLEITVPQEIAEVTWRNAA